MKSREILGYLIGLAVFIILIPLAMWKVSGDMHPGTVQTVLCIIFAAAGIGLSIWSIVYMKNVGRGNPMDAFNHEVAPRTSNLMTGGPYMLCRNPMLLGVFIYYIGLLIYLRSAKAAVLFVLFFAVMMVQVSSEEKRLEQDFGEEYREYKKTTKKLIPFIW